MKIEIKNMETELEKILNYRLISMLFIALGLIIAAISGFYYKHFNQQISLLRHTEITNKQNVISNKIDTSTKKLDENINKNIKEAKNEITKKSNLNTDKIIKEQEKSTTKILEKIEEKSELETIGNHITYLASQTSRESNTGRAALEELQEIELNGKTKEIRETAKTYISEICKRYTDEWDKDIGNHVIKKENLEKVVREEIGDYLEHLGSKNRQYLGNIAQLLSGINSLFGTDFTICNLNEYRKWVANKEYEKILNEHLK